MGFFQYQRPRSVVGEKECSLRSSLYVSMTASPVLCMSKQNPIRASLRQVCGQHVKLACCHQRRLFPRLRVEMHRLPCILAKLPGGDKAYCASNSKPSDGATLLLYSTSYHEKDAASHKGIARYVDTVDDWGVRGGSSQLCSDIAPIRLTSPIVSPVSILRLAAYQLRSLAVVLRILPK